MRVQLLRLGCSNLCLFIIDRTFRSTDLRQASLHTAGLDNLPEAVTGMTHLQCVSPGEWHKSRTGSAAAGGKGAGSRARSWDAAPGLCGGWWWLCGASPRSPAACSAPRAPPAGFCAVSAAGWAPTGSWRGRAHLEAKVSPWLLALGVVREESGWRAGGQG